MKKFISFIAKQQLEAGNYEAVDNSMLKNKLSLSNPIIVVLNSFIKKGETVEMLMVHDKDNKFYEENLSKLKTEIDLVKENKKFNFEVKLVEIEISSGLTSSDHLEALSKMLKNIKEGDELYVDMTYGNKTFPLIEFMVINSAYMLKKNVSIGMVSYGECRFQEKPKKYLIYDETPLFYMAQLIDGLSDIKSNEDVLPEEIIKETLLRKE